MRIPTSPAGPWPTSAASDWRPPRFRARVLLITASSLGAAWLNAPAWPIIISVCGLVLISRNGAADERLQLRRLVEPLLGTADTRSRERSLLRWLLTAALVIGGLVILFNGKERFDLLSRSAACC